MTNIEWLVVTLSRAFPEAVLRVQDPRGDDQHLVLHLDCTSLKDKTRLQRHQIVYAALDNLRQGAIHALSLHINAG